MTKRQLAMTRGCPQCGVLSGQPCKGVNGNGRKSVHAMRLNQRPNPLTQARERTEKAKVVQVGNAVALTRYGDSLVYDAQMMRQHFVAMLGLCGSPIEGLLLEAIVSTIRFDMSRVFRVFEFDANFEPPHKQFASLMPQAQIGPYRVDFLLKDYVGEGRSLVIECDGHNFHEKTKEQARSDKRRDRTMVYTGARILRFTGSEIWADPDACVDEIYTTAEALFLGNMSFRDYLLSTNMSA